MKLSEIWMMDISMPVSYAITRAVIIGVIVLLIGAGYGFGYGYQAADKPLYLAEYNDVVTFRGLNGEVYQIQHVEAAPGMIGLWGLLPGESYVEPSGSYMRHRWGQIVGNATELMNSYED